MRVGVFEDYPRYHGGGYRGDVALAFVIGQRDSEAAKMNEGDDGSRRRSRSQ